MPIYEYQCTACGHKLEALQKFSDAPLTLCPNCQKEALTKLISAAGFQLKGSGWYVTDYRDKGKTSAATKKEDNAESTGKDAQKDVKSGGSSSSNTDNSTSG